MLRAFWIDHTNLLEGLNHESLFGAIFKLVSGVEFDEFLFFTFLMSNHILADRFLQFVSHLDHSKHLESLLF